jgi:exopolysaccharide biosynthesis protein
LRKLHILAFLALACSDANPRTTTTSEPPQSPPPCVSEWRAVAAGIEHRTLNCSGARNLHLVRIDPSRAEIAAKVGKGGIAEAVPAEQGWTAAINANFFDHEFRPLGVVISGGKRLNRLHPVEWESVFFVTKKGEAGIVLPADWIERAATAEVAVQAGPRIVVDGKAVKVVPGRPDSRSGVCIDARGAVILFATAAGSVYNAQEMAEVTATDPNLGCRSAMLFDGGPSTQLFVRTEPPVSVEGDKAVPVILLARPRSVSH